METELELQHVRRLSNTESNRLTKQCIRSATVKLIGEKGFDEVSPTDIINRSGVSRMTFYRHYKSKDDVVADISKDVCAKITEHLQDGLFHTNRPKWYANVFRQVRKDKGTFRIMLEAGMDLTVLFPENVPEANGAWEQYTKQARQSAFCRILSEWFRGGMKEKPEDMGRFCERLLHAADEDGRDQEA